MDVVYVVGPGEDNEELRYSLRSLRNLPHDTVWIAGYTPSWVTGVGRIPVEQAGGKYANGFANIRAACLHPEVSEEFVYFNDDFFVLKPIESMPTYHRGPLRAFLPTMRRRTTRATYTGGRIDTARLIAELGITDPLAYEPIHVPMRFEKAKLLTTLDTGAHLPALHYRTLYGNQWAVGGELHSNVKIANTRKRIRHAFVSTNSRSFGGPVGAEIRALFPDPSPYEVPHVPHQPGAVRDARRDRVRRVQPRRRRRATAGAA